MECLFSFVLKLLYSSPVSGSSSASSKQTGVTGNDQSVISTDPADLTRASTGSLCSSFEPPSPLRWGWPCRGHSDTSCGSSALKDTLQLIAFSIRTLYPAFRGVNHFLFFSLTFLVVSPYLRGHFFLAGHPGQPPFLGGWSLVQVLIKTVQVLRAPCQASPTDNSPPGCLFL